MKKLSVFIMFFVAVLFVQAQNSSDVESIPPTIDNVQEVLAKVKYPIEAREKAIEGNVTVKFFVDENGKLLRSRIDRACDPLLEKAMKEVLDQFEFTPAKIGEKSVAGMVTLPFHFRLEVE